MEMRLVRDGKLVLAHYDKAALGFVWDDTGEPVEEIVASLPWAGAFRLAYLKDETQVFHWQDTEAVVPPFVFELYKRHLAERGRTVIPREGLPTPTTPGPKQVQTGSFK